MTLPVSTAREDYGVGRGFAQDAGHMLGFMPLSLQPNRQPRRQLRVHQKPHHSTANAILLLAVLAA